MFTARLPSTPHLRGRRATPLDSPFESLSEQPDRETAIDAQCRQHQKKPSRGIRSQKVLRNSDK